MGLGIRTTVQDPRSGRQTDFLLSFRAFGGAQGKLREASCRAGGIQRFSPDAARAETGYFLPGIAFQVIKAIYRGHPVDATSNN